MFKTYVLLLGICGISLVACGAGVILFYFALETPAINPALGSMFCITALMLWVVSTAIIGECLGALRDAVVQNRLNTQSNELLFRAGLDPATPELTFVRPPNSPSTGS